jgi:hypothetical protein
VAQPDIRLPDLVMQLHHWPCLMRNQSSTVRRFDYLSVTFCEDLRKGNQTSWPIYSDRYSSTQAVILSTRNVGGLCLRFREGAKVLAPAWGMAKRGAAPSHAQSHPRNVRRSSVAAKGM